MLNKLIRFLSGNGFVDQSKNGRAEPFSLLGAVSESKLAAKELKEAGDACLRSNDLDQAVVLYKKSLEIDAGQAAVYNNIGIALFNLNQTSDALIQYRTAISHNPGFASAYNNQGLALSSLGHLDDALVSYDRAIMLSPDYAEAYYNRGILLVALRRLDDALSSYDRAIELRPEYAVVYNNRGVLLYEMKRFDQALLSYDQAVALKPDYASAYNNRGVLLDSMTRLNEALASYDRAIALRPDYAEAYNNRGVVLDSMSRLDDALGSYSHALLLMPDYEFLYGRWLDVKMQLCDWKDYNNTVARLSEKIKNGDTASPPFFVLSNLENRSLQKKIAEIYVHNKCPADYSLPGIPKRPKRDKICIGYFSADFRNHPVSFLTAELFELHDKSKFHLIAFSFGDVKDEMTGRISHAFDEFIDVCNLSDHDVAVLARDSGVDIAIDLGGFTSGSRTSIFSLRAAPVQLSYLGYLGTMGAEYFDYLISDKTIIPLDHQGDYSEKIIYLPCYQVNDTKRCISDRVYGRAELGLPSVGFVFCCLNNNYKITPAIFDGWMRILKQVPGSVLWLLGDNKTTVANLQAEAVRRGVGAERLIFAKRLPLPEYLASYRCANLFLDTSPYNAGTTASDALWAGLPVLTWLGETFSARVAASLLSAIGLPELVANSQAEYEALAVALATQPERLKDIKQKLADNRLTAPLFDTVRFKRHIEAAYTQIYERYQNGLMPDHIYLE